MAWTNVPKASALAWSTVNPVGKEQYDQATLTYDDATTFYDGVDPAMWTDIAKPSGTVWTNIPKPS